MGMIFAEEVLHLKNGASGVAPGYAAAAISARNMLCGAAGYR
jgi:hypothetical protein